MTKKDDPNSEFSKIALYYLIGLVTLGVLAVVAVKMAGL